jgi:hypothetical protein
MTRSFVRRLYRPRFSNFCLAALLVTLVSGETLRSSGEDEILVGHSATGKLKVEVGFDLLRIEASVFPGLPGYATGDMGFHSAPLDEPANDFFQLSPGADFRWMLLSKDPGMEVLNDHGSAYMTNGESFFVGQAPFDTHPLWNILNGLAGQIYSLTLKVRDLNGVYSESDPVLLEFTPDPPVLTITNSSPGQVTISWTPNTPGFLLQSAPGLTPAFWTNAPTGSTNPITLPASALVRFYRVRR